MTPRPEKAYPNQWDNQTLSGLNTETARRSRCQMTTDLVRKPGLIPVACITLRPGSAPISTNPAHALRVHLQQATAMLSIRSVYSRRPWKPSLTIARISALPVMFPTNFDEDTRVGDSIHEALSILLLAFRALASAVIWQRTGERSF